MFTFISLLLFSFTPYLSVRAAQDEDALTTAALKNVVSVDYGEYFGDLDGSFVLYDMQEDTWYVYNRAQAERRISPDSTYKVYDALFGLEEGVIAPDASVLPWDGTAYPFCGLELRSGFGIRYGKFCELVFSVHRFPAGRRRVQDYLHKISYGNQDSSAGLSSYWLEASLAKFLPWSRPRFS